MEDRGSSMLPAPQLGPAREAPSAPPDSCAGAVGLFGQENTMTRQAVSPPSTGCPTGSGAAPFPQGSGAHPALSLCHALLLPTQPALAAKPPLPVLDWQPEVISQDRRRK